MPRGTVRSAAERAPPYPLPTKCPPLTTITGGAKRNGGGRLRSREGIPHDGRQRQGAVSRGALQGVEHIAACVGPPSNLRKTLGFLNFFCLDFARDYDPCTAEHFMRLSAPDTLPTRSTKTVAP